MNDSILVTGASGVLGRAIVSAALKAGMAVRQGVRDPKKAAPNTEAVRLDYTDPATISPALAGATKLVLMAPPLDPNAAEELGRVIAAAKTSGIKHIVFISALGANYNEQAPLRMIEHAVIDSGIPYTILRPNFFMENFSDGFLSATIRAQRAIYLAAGDGKTSFISVKDIAAVVVEAFQKSLTGQEIDLTGPTALDHNEAVKKIGDAAGRPVVYHSLTEEEMVAGARAQGMPEPAIGYLKMLYGAVRGGFAAGVTTDVEKITGRKPIRFEDFAQGAAQSWK